MIDNSRIIINLASREYSKCIEKYLIPQDKYITITFCELSRGKLVTKGTYAKMARGEMVRYIAEIIMRIITIFIDNRMIVVYNPY